VSRDGIGGRRRIINYKLNDIEWHTIMEVFSVGDTHYALIAAAPLDDFQRYAAEIDKLFASVRFPRLKVKAADVNPKSQ